MKYFIAFIGLMIMFSCKTVDPLQYQYKSTTMLGSRTIIITKDSVVTEYNGRMENTRTARATSSEEWLQLKESMKTVKLNDIADLESPTNRRATDAAPFGSVSITTKDSTYQSAGFDGFDANEQLLPLMLIIKKISETR